MQKPEKIVEIEKLLNITLIETKSETEIVNWGNKNLYILNANAVIIGLNIRSNKITDITFLKDFKGLTTLDLSDNNIIDYTFLKDLKGLTTLNLSFNDITDYTFFKDLKGLATLDLSWNKITDISFLKDLGGLTSLSLSKNNIKDYYFLKDLKELAFLNLGNNNITDITFLKDLKALASLDLSNNNITDITFLKDLKELATLYLSNNNITDYSFLKDLNKLANLYLWNNNITDITFLKDLKGLATLDLKNNKITNIEHFEFIKKLPELMIFAYGNPCFTNASVRLEVRENNYDVIINELKKIEEAKNKKTSIKGYLPEKIVLLGNHSSGKSSLVHYLQEGNLNYNHDTTHILQIKEYNIEEENNVLPDAMIYDFGGQDFYHGIYQTFLTPGAFTLLLWHSTKNHNMEDDDVKKFPIRNYKLNYWLGQWEQKIKPSKLFVIQTHKDQANIERKTYRTINDNITEEFCISLQKENPKDKTPINKAKHSALQFLKESIHEIIDNNRKVINPDGAISLPHYNFIKALKEKGESQKEIPILKKDLKPLFTLADGTEVDETRFNTEIEQLHSKGMLIIHHENVWLNPVALAQYVHDNLLKEKVGNGRLTGITHLPKAVIDLLLDQKVVFEHKFGLNEQQEPQTEYIIPNYLPLIKSSGIDYDLIVFGLDNPLFILQFKDFLPFGFINQLVCYFGRLPDRKKFWRDQLVFTIGETKSETIDKTKIETLINYCKVLIKLDFEHLKIEVFAAFSKETESSKNEIIKYLYYVLLSMYKNYTIEPENFASYKALKETIKLKRATIRTVNFRDINIGEALFEDYFYPDKYSTTFQIEDMYLSLDNEVFVNQKELLALEKEQTIKTYHKNLEPGREKPASAYQSFTPNKINTMKKIFISYNRKDLQYKNDLKKHLSIIERYGLIKAWSCDEIVAGKWNDQIQKELEESDIIIYMVSADFMDSDYIMIEEVKKGIELVNKNPEKKIICVLVGVCQWNKWSVFEDINNKSKSEGGNYSTMDLSQFQFLPYHQYKNQEGISIREEIVALEKWGRYPYDVINEAYNQIVTKVFNELPKV